MHNPNTMNRLSLCPKKAEISGLMRPSPNSGRLSHNPHPTTHNPPHDADLSFVRHQRPFFTPNPLTINNLSLCVKKRQISRRLRHQATATAPRMSCNPLPTTSDERATSRYTLSMLRAPLLGLLGLLGIPGLLAPQT